MFPRWRHECISLVLQDIILFYLNLINFEVYNDKSFPENNNSSNQHAHFIDNFQYDGYGLNIPRRNHLDLMVENQTYFPFNNASETKPLNYVVPDDEVSSIAPTSYYQRGDLNRNNRLLSPTTRRAFKAKKKSSIVKGQWTVDEDRMLIQMVEQYGMRKWSHIAQRLPGRIGKQCRERWHNHLRPDIKVYLCIRAQHFCFHTYLKCNYLFRVVSSFQRLCVD
ncbi:hypothetical protein KIW84_014476 [Lathyrus oleraceus]|uniref:Uncharacterized protein n=1 Tax=Pisum sativum TaxID=3888 RepID=A0A9D5BN89_PEA|nr:hypothetical protein KIW84_014476 [Pisum sativum]